jgi:2-keto-4-pentenoate hydratase/2-oxohepta-3-ene-1,7-dioic acid hydratase in catechol pathway
VPVDSLGLVSPVTAPCRVVAQMTNYALYAKGAGMDPKTVPLTFFRKASGSISGPFDAIIKPQHVKLLDHEVEIGLAIGRDIPVGTELTASNLAEFISRSLKKAEGVTADGAYAAACVIGPSVHLKA